ncbi:MAG: hypothetical protein GC204_15895 [Chloroflexi bacterium]|nr:hypothetical protein [Chloroflexota bacterium]
MADLENLKSLTDLKWDYLADKQNIARRNMRYDDLADMFMLLFVPPEQETVVFYVDGYVGLLIDPETMNVVGLQIDAFRRSFLPNHASVQHWRLSETGVDVQDFGDVILTFDRLNTKIAQEIILATEDVLGEPAAELAAALA